MKKKGFFADNGGNVAIMFGLAALPLFLAAGVAIDYGRASKYKTTLQAAVDVAALAGALDATAESKAKVRRTVKRYLKANGGTDIANNLDFVKVKVKNDGTVIVDAGAHISSSLMKLAGFNKLDFEASATVKNPDGALEVALVLDNTGSMQGGKLTTLKSTAKEFVDTVMHDDRDNVRIALVPFGQYVNVGTGFRNASWLQVPDDSSETNDYCRMVTPVISKTNCETREGTGYNDGTPYTYSYEKCDYEYGDPVEQCGTSTSSSTWRGCVGSRDYPLNVRDKPPGTPIPGIMNVSCPSEITRLTSSKSLVNSEIDNMVASGETYIPSGLMWGWRALSRKVPLTDGASQREVNDGEMKQAIILMTDGANTKSPTYPAHTGSDGDEANDLTAELCRNIKRKNILVYTVTFEVDDDDIKDLMRSCATNSDAYYDADDGAALARAFDNIARQLAAIYLSR